MTFQTLCGTPSEIENLSVNNQSLNVTWEPPTQLNGNPNDIRYIVRYLSQVHYSMITHLDSIQKN